MDVRILWLYSMALASLVWGLFGLRGALAVLAANTTLAVILCFVPDADGLASLLSIGYPFYLYMAFFIFGFIEHINIPAVPVTTRVILGCMGCIGFAVLIHWGWVSHNVRLVHAAYIARVEDRPRLIQEAFADASYEQVCLNSNATLLSLALGAKDQATTAVMLDAFDRCHKASATVKDVVIPLLGSEDMEQIDFIVKNGLKPATLVSGSAYRGSALAYAALVVKSPELVTALLSRYPEEAVNTPFIEVLLNDLTKANELEMRALLEKNGLTGKR